MEPAVPAGQRWEAAALRRLRFALTGLFLLQGLGGFLPGSLLWGLNHLAYAPTPIRLALPLAGLLLLWTPLHRPLGRWLIHIAAPLLLGRRWVAFLLLPGLAMGIFWLLRCRLHFLGDGWLLGELLHRGLPFHGFDFLDYYLHARLYAWLGLESEPAAFRLFAVVSTVAGGGYVAAVAWSARRLTADPGERLLLFGLLLCFAPVQMFAGYVECYALLAVALLLVLTLFVLHYRERLPSYWPAAVYGVALAIHLDALFLAPLPAALILRPPAWNRASLGRRLASVVAPVVACLILAGVLLLLGGYSERWFNHDFIANRGDHPLLVPLLGERGLLRLTHAKDILNLLLLLAPVPLALLAAVGRRGTADGEGGWDRRKDERKDERKGRRKDERKGRRKDRRKDRTENRRGSARIERLLLLTAAWLLFLMVVLHMRLGVVRDWDLFAAQAPVFVFAAFFLWHGRTAGDARAGLVAMALSAGLLLAGPWFWLNAGTDRSLARFRDVITDIPQFPRAYAHEEIAKYFRKSGNLDEAMREYEICATIHPTNARFHALRGALLYSRGDQEAAQGVFERVCELDSLNVTAIGTLARIHAEKQEFAEALPYARRLAGHRQEQAASAMIHGLVAAQFGLLDEAIGAYDRAIRKAPDQLELRERLGALLIAQGDYARAERVLRVVVRLGRRTETALAGLLVALWMPCQQDPESCRGPDGEVRLREALALIEQLDERGATSEQIEAWRAEIRARLGS
ncbi:MAG: tetratricopeptide repeat protein [Candidatus Eisenbacteria sp.]|nr:tetratricopeptide repeat protein [Candidatus Eisenbacteria bacterium]